MKKLLISTTLVIAVLLAQAQVATFKTLAELRAYNYRPDTISNKRFGVAALVLAGNRANYYLWSDTCNGPDDNYRRIIPLNGNGCWSLSTVPYIVFTQPLVRMNDTIRVDTGGVFRLLDGRYTGANKTLADSIAFHNIFATIGQVNARTTTARFLDSLAQVRTALAGKQPAGDYVLSPALQNYVTSSQAQATYAGKVHSHPISDVAGLQDSLTLQRQATAANSAALATKQPAGNYALVSAIPTNNNQLTNGAGYITLEKDSSVTNELQNLSIDGQNLSISLGNTVTLPVPNLSNYATITNVGSKTDTARFKADSAAKTAAINARLKYTDTVGNYALYKGNTGATGPAGPQGVQGVPGSNATATDTVSLSNRINRKLDSTASDARYLRTAPVTSVNTRTGAITITNADIIAGLGYTPANDYTNAVTTAGDSAVFYITTNKLTSGTALYTTVLHVNPIVNDRQANYTFSWAISADKKTIVVRVNRAVNTTIAGVPVLGGLAPAPSGIVVNLLVKGT